MKLKLSAILFLLFASLFAHVSFAQTPQEEIASYEKNCANHRDLSRMQYACIVLGSAYTGEGSLGKKIRVDYKKAAVYLQRACDIGELNGCDRLAELYIEGKGVKKDIAHGIDLKKYACLNSVGRDISCKGCHSCFSLGLAYEEGEIVKKNLDEAEKWYGEYCDRYGNCDPYNQFMRSR